MNDVTNGFRFRGGHVALDLAATLAGRLTLTARDRLETPADLRRWLKAAGVAECANPTGNDLQAARELREAIYALASAASAGGSLPGDAVRLVNSVAAKPSAAPQLGGQGELTLAGDPAALLSHIAREAIELVGGDFRHRIRKCEGEGCALLFVDTSRTGSRRWCSMSGCGNRAKVAQFRTRAKARTP